MKENILATVGEKEITAEMMLQIMRTMPPEEAGFVSSEEGRKLLLDEMIAGELLYFDAIDQKMQEEKDFLDLLEEAKKGLLQRYRVGRLFQSIEVSDREIADYYAEHSADFKSSAKVSAKHILVDSLEKAEEIAKEIEAGKPFVDAAKEYSSCPSSARGGDLGAFGKGQMVKEFEEVAFSLAKNQVSQPVKTEFGYHLIQVDDVLPEGTKTLEEVKEGIRRILAKEKQKAVYHQKLEEIKQKYPVTVNLGALK